MLSVLDKILVAGVATAIAIMVQNPTAPWQALKQAQIQIIREVGKTSNWDDPLIWHQRHYKRQ